MGLVQKMPERRFSPPWSVEELEAARSGQKLAYVYFEEKPGRHSAAKLLTRGPLPSMLLN